MEATSESFDPSELMGSDVPFADPFSFDERLFLPAYWEPALRQAETQARPDHRDRTHQTTELQQKQSKQHGHDAHSPGLPSSDPGPSGRSPTYAELARVGMRMPTRMPQPRAELLNLETEPPSSDAVLAVHRHSAPEVDPNCRSRKRAAEHALKANSASDSELDMQSPDFEGEAGAGTIVGACEGASQGAGVGEGVGEGKSTHDGARTNPQHRPSPRVRCKHDTRTKHTPNVKIIVATAVMSTHVTSRYKCTV